MKPWQKRLDDGISRRQEGILTFLLFLANMTTDILVCWEYYKNWTENTRNESNFFSIMIIGAILLTNSFQLHAIFMKYQDITSSLLQQSNASCFCHFLFVFLYSFLSMIGFAQPLFLLIIWRLKHIDSHLNWSIFRTLNIIQSIYQSSIGGTVQIYLLITEKQHTNPLILISVIISVLCYSINISNKYKPITNIEYKIKYKHIGKERFAAMPFHTFYVFYIVILTDYLLRSIMLSLSLNLIINSRAGTLYYLLFTFFIIPYLIIYVLYFLRVYFEYQVKFNWLARVFRFNQKAMHRRDIRNFYIFKAIYYPILTVIRGCNCGWMFIVNCDPKQITQSFIQKCSRNQADADALKIDALNNWKYLKDPIYALCRINLVEIVIKYLSNLILFVIIAVISYNEDIANFDGWFVVLCCCMVLFVVSFWFWLETVWQHPLIYQHVFIDQVSSKHIQQNVIKQQEPQPQAMKASVELSPLKHGRTSNGTQNSASWKE